MNAQGKVGNVKNRLLLTVKVICINVLQISFWFFSIKVRQEAIVSFCYTITSHSNIATSNGVFQPDVHFRIFDVFKSDVGHFQHCVKCKLWDGEVVAHFQFICAVHNFPPGLHDVGQQKNVQGNVEIVVFTKILNIE
jgi:hypothetical protein